MTVFLHLIHWFFSLIGKNGKKNAYVIKVWVLQNMHDLLNVILIGDEEKLDKFIGNNKVLLTNILNESACLIGVKQPIANMMSP